MDYKTLPLVEITWEDHFSSDEWTTQDDVTLAGSVFVTTIGYLIKETRTKIVLAQNVSSAGNISGTMTILKKTVKTRTVIREA
jgi:hypothetical protein